jgi:hypothetical protein
MGIKLVVNDFGKFYDEFKYTIKPPVNGAKKDLD